MKKIFKVLIFLLISISISKADLLKPSNEIKPAEVVRIQLTGLQKNDLIFKDSGIEQTWKFWLPHKEPTWVKFEWHGVWLKAGGLF